MENIENIVEVTELEPIEDTCSGMNTGVAVLVGAGLALAAVAVGKFVKNKWQKHKAKKEQSTVVLDEDSYEEVDESEDEE